MFFNLQKGKAVLHIAAEKGDKHLCNLLAKAEATLNITDQVSFFAWKHKAESRNTFAEHRKPATEIPEKNQWGDFASQRVYKKRTSTA